MKRWLVERIGFEPIDWGQGNDIELWRWPEARPTEIREDGGYLWYIQAPLTWKRVWLALYFRFWRGRPTKEDFERSMALEDRKSTVV